MVRWTLFLSLLLAGCGSSPAGSPPCREGAAEPCLCEDGEGVRVCADRRWGACVCGEADGVLDLSALPEDPTGRADRLFDFGEVAIGTLAERHLLVKNAGTARLAATVQAPPPPFAASPAELAIVAGGSDAIRVSVTPEEPGSFEGILRISAGDVSARVRLVASGVDADVTCSGTDVDFGTIPVGGERIRTAAVCVNDGTTAGTVAFELLGDAGSFGIPPTVRLEPGARLDLFAAFRPVEVGEARATLRIAAGGRQLLESTFAGEGTQPGSLVLTPRELDFGAVRPGDVLEFLLRGTNPLDHPVTIYGLARDVSGPFEFGDYQPTVPPHGEVLIPVRFAPQLEGRFEGRLGFDYGLGYEDWIPIRGRAGGPILRCDPALDTLFTSLAVPRRTGRFACRNEGTGTEPAVLASVTSSSPLFTARLVDRTAPVELAPRQSVEVEVTFAPVGEGRVDAVVKVEDGIEGTRQEVGVSGWGLELPPTCEWRMIPSSLRLGIISDGDEMTVEVALPAGSCLVYEVRPDTACADDVTVSGLRQRQVGTGVETSFDLHVRGGVDCDLVFEVADVDEPERRVELVAQASNPACLELSPDLVDFGTSGPGCVTDPRTVSVTNACSGSKRLLGAYVEDAVEFRLEPFTPVTLDPGAAATLAVRYAPVSSGAHVDALVVEVENSPPYLVTLKGQADPALGCGGP